MEKTRKTVENGTFFGHFFHLKFKISNLKTEIRNRETLRSAGGAISVAPGGACFLSDQTHG